MAKYIVQIIITGSQLLGRAFAKAVKEEIRTSQEAAKRLGHHSKAEDIAANAGMGMTIDEAKRILDITNLDLKEVRERYDFLFDANEEKRGGTLYIRSKIVRAKERLDYELMKAEAQRKKDTS